MERLLTENTSTGKYEILQSTNGSLNTTGGGAGTGSTVIQGSDGSSNITIKTNSLGNLITNDSQITVGNAQINSPGTLQSVLQYGKHTSGNLIPMDITSSGRQIVDVIELNLSGKISTSSALSSIQICGYREDTGNTFHTLKVSSDGTLFTKKLISRGTISVSSPFSSGSTSTAIDVGDKKNFNFHMVGAGNSHTGFFVQGSNDNVNFERVQEFSPQTVGASSYIGGSVSKGFRYYKIENGGADSSITFSVYNLTD